MSTTPAHAAPSGAATILGREPVAWLGLIEAALTLLLAFSLGVSQTTYGPILAVVVAAFGVYTAWATKDTALGAIIGLVKTCLVLAAVYGLTFTDEQTAAIIMVVTTLATFFQRTQTSPVANDGIVSPSPDAVVVTDPEGRPAAV